MIITVTFTNEVMFSPLSVSFLFVRPNYAKSFQTIFMKLSRIMEYSYQKKVHS